MLMQGFASMTILMIILAAAYTQIVATSKWLFIVMYAFTFFFANFGPNSVTFIQPVELFETRFRSTLHGISAAAGTSQLQQSCFTTEYTWTTVFHSLSLSQRNCDEYVKEYHTMGMMP